MEISAIIEQAMAGAHPFVHGVGHIGK